MVQELINIQKSLTGKLGIKQKLLNIVENFPQLLVRVRQNSDEPYYYQTNPVVQNFAQGALPLPGWRKFSRTVLLPN